VGAQGLLTVLAYRLFAGIHERSCITLSTTFLGDTHDQVHRSTSTHPLSLPALIRHAFFILGVCFLVILFAIPQSAAAQGQDAPESWKQHVVAQIETLLQAPQANVRAAGMELIVELKDDDALAHKLTSLRPQLYALFFDVRNTDEERLLALSALFATDLAETRQALATWTEEEVSPRVQRALQQRG
jgi:hypothetical protein